jgi:hypothetical protein
MMKYIIIIGYILGSFVLLKVSDTLFRDYKNLGHVYLAKKRKALAVDCYFEAIEWCGDSKKGLAEIKDDLKYLEQYGVTPSQYAHITQKIMLEMRKL